MTNLKEENYWEGPLERIYYTYFAPPHRRSNMVEDDRLGDIPMGQESIGVDENASNDGSADSEIEVSVVVPPPSRRSNRNQPRVLEIPIQSPGFAVRARDNNQDNLPPAQRQRTIQAPVDRNLLGTRAMRTNEIKLTQLMNENIENEVNLGKTHMVVEILRIITPQTGNTGNAVTRFQRRQIEQRIMYVRILLCRNDSKLCYIMMNNESNKRIFHRDLLLRDNGTITCGTYMRLLAPYPVERMMEGIPLVKTSYPAIVMERPANVPAIVVNSYIQGNNSAVAILRGAILHVTRTTPIQITCTGKHCDKQRPLDWTNTVNRGCGCWGTTSLGTSNIAFMHNITLNAMGGNVIKMNNFSSQRFNTYFMDRPIPPNIVVTSFENTDVGDNLEDAIEQCVDLINENGGFQVTLWYTRGEINDQALVGMNAPDNAQVDAGRINYHVVTLEPDNRSFKDSNSLLATQLKNLKFNVGDNF